jgi:hypothetical protein
LHPLSRDPFTPEDYVAIEAKLPADLKERFEKSKRNTLFDIMNEHIVDVLGIIRTVNFLNILSEHSSPKKTLATFLQGLRGTSSIVAFLVSEMAPAALVDALMKSLPKVSEDVQSILDSTDLEKKRLFFQSLSIPHFDYQRYQTFINTADLFSLVKVMTSYSLDTEFQM